MLPSNVVTSGPTFITSLDKICAAQVWQCSKKSCPWKETLGNPVKDMNYIVDLPRHLTRPMTSGNPYTNHFLSDIKNLIKPECSLAIIPLNNPPFISVYSNYGTEKLNIVFHDFNTLNDKLDSWTKVEYVIWVNATFTLIFFMGSWFLGNMQQ